MGSETNLTGRDLAEAIAEYDRLGRVVEEIHEEGEALRRRTSGVRSLQEEARLRELAASKQGLEADRSRLAEDLVKAGVPEDVLVPCEFHNEEGMGYVVVGRAFPRGFALSKVPADVVGVLGDGAKPESALRLREEAARYEGASGSRRAWMWMWPSARALGALVGAVLLFLFAAAPGEGGPRAVEALRGAWEGATGAEPWILAALAFFSGLWLVGATFVLGGEAAMRLRELGRLERVRRARGARGLARSGP